jgi:hypothetical protein
MSEIIYDGSEFTVAAHSTFSLRAAFNGTPTRGGDNMGPVVVGAWASRVNQSVHVSTASMMAVSRDGNSLTSRTVYLFTVTNHNPFHVNFSLQYFCDG